MEKEAGKYYSRFKDETWEKTLSRNNGFESLLDAVQDSLLNETNTYTFLVSDYEGNILFDSANQEEEHLNSLVLVKQANRFFIKADYDNSLSEAISDHSKGFASEQDAIDDMENEYANSRDRVIYYIYHLTENLKFDQVYVGQVGNL